MLVYARIILALIILSCIMQILLSGIGIFAGAVLSGVFGLLFAGLFIWLAYTNFRDATECANKAFIEEYKKSTL